MKPMGKPRIIHLSAADARSLMETGTVRVVRNAKSSLHCIGSYHPPPSPWGSPGEILRVLEPFACCESSDPPVLYLADYLDGAIPDTFGCVGCRGAPNRWRRATRMVPEWHSRMCARLDSAVIPFEPLLTRWHLTLSLFRPEAP